MPVPIRNILTLARREFLWRARSRTFVLTTAILAVVGVGVALAPVLFRYVDVGGPTKIGLAVGDTRPSLDVASTLQAMLNATASNGTDTNATDGAFEVLPVADVAAARRDVTDGRLAGVIVLSRAANGDLAFTGYTKALAFERTPQLVRQAASAIAVQDRLAREGIDPAEQARLFAPASFTLEAPDPSAKKAAPSSPEGLVSSYSVAFAATIFIFMAIMLYGQWVAMSVAEEKNSRVMELILGAATPFQLLSGKVLGVGAAAVTQYVLMFVPAALAILFQDRIASLVLGGNATADLPAGLTIELLVAFGILFVLGFALYAVLYAGAASLVSRQEDINQMVAPLTLLSTLGYLVAAWAASGLIDPTSTLVVVLSFVPLTSPYLMLSRLGAGLAGPFDFALAVGLLLVTIPVALWAAARLYRAGVLMYGQKPSIGTLVRTLRTA
jgi:ABC-2 type transport system permease protein